MCTLMGTWVPTTFVALISLLGSLAAASIVLLGNRLLQSGLGRRLREAEELKQRLYRIIGSTADYWAISGHNRKEREILEARILADKSIIMSQLSEMQRHTRGLRRWYKQTEHERLDLFDAMTGGRFQQKVWSPDPARVILAARSIRLLVSSLNQAH
jgi:hypothetical protein